MRAVIEINGNGKIAAASTTINVDYNACGWLGWSSSYASHLPHPELGASSGTCKHFWGTLTCYDTAGKVVLTLSDFPRHPKVANGDGMKMYATGSISPNSSISWTISKAPFNSGNACWLDDPLAVFK